MDQGLPARPEYMSSPPVCNKNNTTSATYGAGTAYSSGVHEFTTGFQWGSCCSIFSFLYSVLMIVVFFPLVIVLFDHL
jgi:hypothetical protein